MILIRNPTSAGGKMLRTPNFWAGKWWEVAWRYCFLWVFCKKHWWETEPSSILERRISRKGRHPLSSTSIVNLMDSDWEFRWLRNRSKFSWPWGQTKQVSSTNLFHFLGWNWGEAKDLVSKYSTNKFEIMGVKRRTHCNPTSLFKEITLEAKKSGGKAKNNQFGYVIIGYLINDIDGLLNRDFFIKEDNIKVH